MSTPPSAAAGEESCTRVLIRFSATERAFHWSIALPALVLLLSGLFLRFESLQTLMVGYHRRVGLRLHLLAGVVLLCVPLLVALLGDRRALAAAGRALLRMDREDRRFLRELPRWLGNDPEAGGEVGRFNGGQKLNSLVSGLTLLLASGTGLFLWIFPSRSGLGAALAFLHEITTYILLPVVAGHLYMALVHRRTRESLRGILFGFVDAEWARRQHPHWYREVTGPSGAPQAAGRLGADGENETPGGRHLPPGGHSAPAVTGSSSRSSPGSSRRGGGPPAV
jgi:formate dehydrogenase subunit gamma